MIVFDIETGPLPLDELKAVVDPFDPDSIADPGEFDPSTVKLGNVKDPVKQKEKIESARQKHEQAVADYKRKLKNGEADYWSSIESEAAKKAHTGRVVAIGYMGLPARSCAIDGIGQGEVDEERALRNFWSTYNGARNKNRRMVGFNICNFDLPFLIRRSWWHEIDVPPTVLKDWRFWDPILVDLYRVWGCGEYRPGGKLGLLARFFGIGDKPEDGTTGADFARLWFEDRERAKNYLTNDLEMTANLAAKLGVF